MRYKILAVALLSLATLTVIGLDQQAEIKKLETERAKLTQQQMDKRLEILNTNEECRTLHNQLMALHRELALKIDANPEMHELNLKASEIDRQIDDLKISIKP